MLVSFISFIYFGIAKPLIHLVDGCNKRKKENGKKGATCATQEPFYI